MDYVQVQRTYNSYDASICIQKMARKKKKDPFCGDTLNTLANIDKEFHWYRAYNWYSNMCAEDASLKHLRIIRLIKYECMPKVFNVAKFMLWSSKCFDAPRRRIQVGDNTI